MRRRFRNPWLLALALLLLGLLAAEFVVPDRPLRHPWFDTLPERVVIAHRGASAAFPENTLLAMGVHGLVTDYPDRAAALLSARGVLDP